MIFKILGQITAGVLLYKTSVFIWIYFLKPSKISKYSGPLNGKQSWALVTGASDGIGLETTRALLGRGFNAILHGRNSTKLTKIMVELQKDFPKQKVLFVIADAMDALPSATSVAAEVQDVVHKHNGRLSVLVNNVGGSIRFNSRAFYTVEEGSDEIIAQITSLNALFPHVLTKLLLPTLQEDGNPSLVIFIGSVAGYTGMPYIAAYSSAKAANHAFATALSEEMTCAGSNVEVLGVVVGNVETTGNKFTDPGFGTINTEQMARDILARVRIRMLGLGNRNTDCLQVGCGVPCIIGNWRHAVQGEMVSYMPNWLSLSVTRKVMIGFKDKEEKML